MTTCSYDLTLNDRRMYYDSGGAGINHRQEIEHGEAAPFIANEDSAERVLIRLFDNMRQASGNNFW